MERKEKLLAEREELLREIDVSTEGLRKVSTPERSLQYVKAFFGTGSDGDYRREKTALAEEKIKQRSVRYLAEPWVLRYLMYEYKKDWAFAMLLGSKQIEAALKILDDNAAGSFTSSRLQSWLVKAYAEYQSQNAAEQADCPIKRKATNWEHLLEKCQLRFVHALATLHRMCDVSWTRVNLIEISMRLLAGKLPKNLQRKEVTELTFEISKVDDSQEMMLRKARFGDDGSGAVHAYHVLHFSLTNQAGASEFIRSLKEFVDLIARPQLFKQIPEYREYRVMRDPESSSISLVIVADSTVADICSLFETEKGERNTKFANLDLFESVRVTASINPRIKDLLKRKRICLHGIGVSIDGKMDRELLTLCGFSGNVSGLRSETHWSSLPDYIDNPLYSAIKSFQATDKSTRRLKVASKFWSKFINGQVHLDKAESLFERWVVEATFALPS